MNRAIEAQNNLRIYWLKESADYVRDLKASHDALLDIAKSINEIETHQPKSATISKSVKQFDIVKVGVTKAQLLATYEAIANAEKLK